MEMDLEMEGIQELGPMEAFAWVLGGALLLDVREPDEIREKRIPGAVEMTPAELRERWEEIPSGRPLVVYCRSGNRSYDACGFLDAKGRGALANLEGGIIAWEQDGLPIVGEKAPDMAEHEPEVAEWIEIEAGLSI